jgi:hypothetical protein
MCVEVEQIKDFLHKTYLHFCARLKPKSLSTSIYRSEHVSNNSCKEKHGTVFFRIVVGGTGSTACRPLNGLLNLPWVIVMMKNWVE